MGFIGKDLPVVGINHLKRPFDSPLVKLLDLEGEGDARKEHIARVKENTRISYDEKDGSLVNTVPNGNRPLHAGPA